MTQPDLGPPRPCLHTLDGHEAPARLIADLAFLRSLPPAAKQDLWGVLRSDDATRPRPPAAVPPYARRPRGPGPAHRRPGVLAQPPARRQTGPLGRAQIG